MTARRANKIDGNQTAIVEALRWAGCSVQSLAAVGSGVPDLLVGTRGDNILMEVKDPTQALSDRRLTPHQKKWHSLWLGKAHVVETAEQALAIVAFYRGRKAA